MFNPFHPKPSPGFLSLECLTEELRYPKRYPEMLLQCGPLGEVWMTIEDNGFYFPFGVWGTLVYFCVCVEGGVPLGPCLCTYTKGRGMSGTPLYLSLLYAPETGSLTVQGLTVFCLRSVVGSPRDLPSPSAPNGGVTGVHRYTQLFRWDLDPELHAWARRAITYWAIFPAPKSNHF